MGIHDFVDFIRRNGQSLEVLELCSDNNDDDEYYESTAGSSTAVLVRIPTTYTKRDILSWSLTEFGKFHIIETNYSWDAWDFEPSLGYGEILMGDNKWYDMAIWECQQYPGEWLVNFEPVGYEIFVLGKHDINNVPWGFYKQVFENRNDSCPYTSIDKPSIYHNDDDYYENDDDENDENENDDELIEFYRKCKLAAYNKIVDSGEANLFEYDDKQLLKYPNEDFDKLLEDFSKYEVYRTVYKYSFTEKPKELLNTRFNCLLGDKFNEMKDIAIPFLHKGYIHENLTETEIRFRYNLQVSPYCDILNGCIICEKTRSIGHYTCYDHLSKEINGQEQYMTKLDNEYKKLCENIKMLKKFLPPKNFTVKFTERSVKYNIEFNMIY